MENFTDLPPMRRQKRIALVNDMTGFGRCSIAVGLPLISAMKIQACPLPTAILSVHTGFESHYMDDYTERMVPYMENWADNGIYFDGICTGFLGSAKQIGLVAEFIERFAEEETITMVDPVMGDNGTIYSSYTPELCSEMKKLLEFADIITPNLTEACRLLDMEYPEDGLVGDDDLAKMAKALSGSGPRQVVITGIDAKEGVKNFVYEKGKNPLSIVEPKVGRYQSGTGDAFAAILAGGLVNGMELENAVIKSAAFITKTMRHAAKLDLPGTYGLPFEEFLTEL